jgi:cytochrome c5
MKSTLAIAFLTSLLMAVPAAAGNPSKTPHSHEIDGEAAYKANCTRCHIAIHTYSARSERTMISHMRVRANLTKDEADAIFQYMAGEQKPKAAPTHTAKGAAIP